MAGTGIAAGMAEAGGRAAVATVVSSFSGLLFKIAMSRVATEFTPTPSDPVFLVTGEIQEVFRLYKKACEDSSVTGDENPVRLSPRAGDANIPLSGWISHHLQLSGLRRPVVIAAEFKPIVKNIIGKLMIFNSMRNKGWRPGPTAWDTLKPISNYPLVIFLLLAATVNAAGDAIRELDIDIAIKMATAAEKFCSNIMTSAGLKARQPTPRNQNEIVLADLLLGGPVNGIERDLAALKQMFISKKSRSLFEKAVNKGNTALSLSIDKIDQYFISWLHSNSNPATLPTLSEISVASSMLVKYPRYSGEGSLLLAPDGDERNLIATIKKICSSAATPEAADNLYWLLRVWFLPLTLNEDVDAAGDFEATIISMIAKNTGTFPTATQTVSEVLKRTFVEKMQSLIFAITYSINPTGIPMVGDTSVRAFTPEQSKTIAESLWQLCLVRYSLKLTLEIGRDLHYVGIMLGTFAGAYIPEIARYFKSLLDKASIELEKFRLLIRSNALIGHYTHLDHLNSLITAAVGDFSILSTSLAEAASDLDKATQGDYLAEMKSELKTRLQQVVKKLGILFPERRETFEREFRAVLARVASVVPPVTESITISQSMVAIDKTRLSEILFKEPTVSGKACHLDIINEAYRPSSRGFWKTAAAKRAKAALGDFVRGKPHVQPIGGILTKISFMHCTLQELNTLINLVIRIYAISKQTKKHVLHDELGSGFATGVFTVVTAPTAAAAPPAARRPTPEMPPNRGAGAMPGAPPTPAAANVFAMAASATSAAATPTHTTATAVGSQVLAARLAALASSDEEVSP